MTRRKAQMDIMLDAIGTEMDIVLDAIRNVDTEDYKVCHDGKLVHTDRWETGFRKIADILGMSPYEFKISNVVERVWDMERRLSVYESCVGSEEVCLPGPDGSCQDSDGCPTELAVLQRFWRMQQTTPTQNTKD